MTDFGDDDDIVETAVPTSSVWADLTREHAELAAERDPLYLRIPGYDHLVARYRYVPLGQTKKSTKALMKIKDVTDATVFAAIHSLLLAIEELMVTHPDGVKPVGRDGDELFDLPLLALANPGDPPIQFDDRLCAGMGWDSGRAAAQIVRDLFAQNERAILEHAGELAEWTNGAAREVRDDFVEG